MLIKEIKRRLYKKHGNIVSIDESSYKGFKKKAIFIDRDYGKWEAQVAAVCRGTRHPLRARDLSKISVTDLQKRLDKKFKGIIKVDTTTYKNLSSKCRFIDEEYGDWVALPQNVLAGKGHPIRAGIAKAASQRMSQKDIENLLDEVHGGKVKIVDPYQGMLIKHKFHHEIYGEFYALPANVIHKGTSHIKDAVEKRVLTSLKNYGVKHPMQDPDIALLCAKNNVKSEIILHWETKEPLVCVASYERKTIKWLNNNKIRFKWQHKTFIMPGGGSYRPDLYLIRERKWVEIKGYLRPSSMKKWNWFHKLKPNSELWDKIKLKEIGIL